MSLINWKDRMLTNEFFGDDFGFLSSVNKGISIPAVNVSESDLSYTLEIAIPGKSKEDFKIEVKEDYLVLSSEEEKRDEVEEKNYTKKEYSFSKFQRSFKLPPNCNRDEIDAWYENGILYITIEKDKVSITQKRTIEVS